MNMVKAEFYKLKKSKPFWVCLCVCIFMAALLPFALAQAVASGEPDVQDLSLSAVEITRYAFSMPILTMVAAVFTAIGMTLRSNGASIGVNICLVSIFLTLLSAADFIFKRIGFQLSTGWIDANLSAVATWTPASGALLTGVLVGCVWLLLGIVGGQECSAARTSNEISHAPIEQRQRQGVGGASACALFLPPGLSRTIPLL